MPRNPIADALAEIDGQIAILQMARDTIIRVSTKAPDAEPKTRKPRAKRKGLPATADAAFEDAKL